MMGNQHAREQVQEEVSPSTIDPQPPGDALNDHR
jgi:hypothetical protein